MVHGPACTLCHYVLPVSPRGDLSDSPSVLYVTLRRFVRYAAPRPRLTVHAACSCSLVHVTTGHAGHVTGFV